MDESFRRTSIINLYYHVFTLHELKENIVIQTIRRISKNLKSKNKSNGKIMLLKSTIYKIIIDEKVLERKMNKGNN